MSRFVWKSQAMSFDSSSSEKAGQYETVIVHIANACDAKIRLHVT